MPLKRDSGAEIIGCCIEITYAIRRINLHYFFLPRTYISYVVHMYDGFPIKQFQLIE